ncbi:uncharacterized protein J3D65DRAFT_225468 [Phyllosticta citribraziliensis]|uniref:Fucose-specific lectin n=1 Tax=Phyllosticta citribraziliensis TaxID=989973 RepID=A0ABR1M523_9PEZI
MDGYDIKLLDVDIVAREFEEHRRLEQQIADKTRHASYVQAPRNTHFREDVPVADPSPDLESRRSSLPSWQEKNVQRRPRRKRVGILLLIIALAGIAGIAGGFGGYYSKNQKYQQSISLLQSSRLSALNFTDVSGHENHLVYYQANGLDIFQAMWNSTTLEWQTSRVTGADCDVKNNTPIAANVYWKSNDEMGFHVYYLDSQNVIQRRWSSLEDGVWYGAQNGTVVAAASSDLASQGSTCYKCLQDDMIIFQDDAGNLQMSSVVNGTWNTPEKSVVASNVSQGTGFAVVPQFSINPTTFAVFYHDSKKQTLEGTLWNGTTWNPWLFDSNLWPPMSMAAFAFGWDKSQKRASKLQILATNSEGLLAFTNWNTTSGWTVPTTNAKFLEYTTVATNEAGRFYGITRPDNEHEVVHLTQWAYDDDGNYEWIGNVDI